MLKRNNIYVFFVLMIILFNGVSCKKFLTSFSQNKTYIQSAADVKEVLIGDAYLSTLNISSNFYYSMDDDLKLATFNTLNRPVMNLGFHYWLDNPWINSEGATTQVDPNFTQLYAKIVRINSILASVDFLMDKGEPKSQLEESAGEALFLRAYYYFILVHQYGMPYAPRTANVDFGVPLKIKAGVEDDFAKRATTGQVYNQILSDLYQAEKYLSKSPAHSKIRANVFSVNALLSRVSLFMENYEQAVLYADKVIANQQYGLFNLNNYQPSADFATIHSPEIIFSMAGNKMPMLMGLSADEFSGIHYLPSDDLLASFQEHDLRKTAFFLQNSKGVYKFAKKRSLVESAQDASDFYLIRLAEVYLNKAEALAQQGKVQEARNVLNYFLPNRYQQNSIPVIQLEGKDLISYIREERRRELCLEAHRWFDLRRYAVNTNSPFMKKIIHRNITFSGTGFIVDGYYELGTYAEEPGAYMVPIFNEEIEFNDGHLVNAQRPVRTLKH